MWQQRYKKLRDNPWVVFSFLRNHLYYRWWADKTAIEATSRVTRLSGAETIAAITSRDTSLVRVGDGTIGYLLGASIYFNNWHFRFNRPFARALGDVFTKEPLPNLLYCYPFKFIEKDKAMFAAEGIAPEWSIWIATKIVVARWLRPGQTYGDAFCFHPHYNPTIDFAALKRYFDTKHIIIITGNTARFAGLSLGLSTTFIEGPSSDAWAVRDQLEAEAYRIIAEKGFAKNEVLLMVSAAEAAKVMIYNFTAQGYTAWDTGQFFDLAAKEITALAAQPPTA